MKKFLAIVLVVALAAVAVFAADPTSSSANQSAFMKYEVKGKYEPAFIIAKAGEIIAIASNKAAALSAGESVDLIAAGNATLFDLVDKTWFNQNESKSFTVQVSADGWKLEGNGDAVIPVSMSFVGAETTENIIVTANGDKLTVTYAANQVLDRRADNAGVKLASLKAAWVASAQTLVGMYYTNVSVNVVTN